MKRKYIRRQGVGQQLNPTEFITLLLEREDWSQMLEAQDELLGLLGVAKFKAKAEVAKKAKEPSSVWWIGEGPLELSTMATYIITYLHGWWEFQRYASGAIAIVPGNPELVASLPVSPCPENIVWVAMDNPMFGIPFDEFRDSEGRQLQIVFGINDPTDRPKVETLDLSDKPKFGYVPYDPIGRARVDVSYLE